MTNIPLSPWPARVARTVTQLALRHGWLVVLPVGVCLMLAAGHIVFGGKSYRASQSLAVRDDLLGDSFKPGRYTSLESLKNAQEILSHLARRPAVIRDALIAAASKPVNAGEDWPDEDLIEQLQGVITVVGSNGAEFGKTEVVVLAVRQSTREKARALVEQLAIQVELHLRELRINQLRSMRSEQEQAVAAMERSLADFNRDVQQVEDELGADLGTLRSLLENNGGPNELLRALEQIRSEKRIVEHDRERIEKQLVMLQAFDEGPDGAAVVSGELLELHPSLKRLYEGLADGQIRLSTERGRYTENHVAVTAAEQALVEVQRQLTTEAQNVQRQLSNQQLIVQQDWRRLDQAEQDYVAKLARIGQHRVTYQSLIDELSKRTEALAEARNRLLELRALSEPTTELTLLTPVGAAQVDTRPQGPSKSMLLIAAFLGGLAIGGGILVLRLSPTELRQLRELLDWRSPSDLATASDAPRADAQHTAPTTPSRARQVSESAATRDPSAARAKPATTPVRLKRSAEAPRPAQLVKQASESATTSPLPVPESPVPAGPAVEKADPVDGSPEASPELSQSAGLSETAGPTTPAKPSRVVFDASKLMPIQASQTPPVPGEDAAEGNPSTVVDMNELRARLDQIIAAADDLKLADLADPTPLDGPESGERPVISSVEAYCHSLKRTPRKN